MPTNSTALTALTVTGDLPPTPCVLLPENTVARIESLTTDAAGLKKITTAAEMHQAAQLLREIAGLNRDIDKMRLDLGKPFRDFTDRINAAAKAQTSRLDAAERTLRPALTAYQVEQERIARAEAERQRLEQEKIAAAARKLEEDRARAAREAAERADADLVDTDDDGMADLAADIEEDDMTIRAADLAAAASKLAATRAVVAPVAAGLSYGTRLKHEVTDVHQLSTNLVIVTPNEAEIKRLFVTGWKDGNPLPTVPGIKFTTEKYTIVRR